MRFWVVTLWAIFALPLTSSTDAQVPTVRLGAVLPLTGSDADLGRVQEGALRAALETVRSRGLEIELQLADSRSLPAESSAEAEALIAAGVHALLCCSSPAEAAALFPLAEVSGIPLLSLASEDSSGSYWSFSLAPGERASLEQLALEPELQPTFLMAPTGAAGDLAARLFSGRAGTVRYPAGRTPLTPEALWAITRTPASIVIWDDAAGTLEAARALTERGYGGNRIVPATVWPDLDALGRATLTGAESVLSPAALGYTLSDRHPSKAAVASFRRALIGTPGSFLTETALTQGAAAWDAVTLLAAAAEQVLAYTPDGAASPEVSELRQSLRDALVGLGPLVGAGGTYDFSEQQRDGPLPSSLVLGTWRGGAFRPQ